MSLFKKAEKKQARLRLGITGPSGSGKTFSALRLAKGFGGKIAVIDTEKGSASLYADRFEFDVLELTPPYSPDRYIEAMTAAVNEGYQIIIMDSISHAWAGEGGILNIKEKLDARGGNSFANWAKMTPMQEKFIAALINCPAHLIVTMRSKQEHVQVSENGKTKIQKVGLAPIQRDGFEYELTTVFDIAINHEAETSKDRTGLFVDKIFQVSEETGKTLKSWLESGSKVVEQKQSVDNKQNQSIIKPEEVANCGIEKEQSHIIYNKEETKTKKASVKKENTKTPLTNEVKEKATLQENNPQDQQSNPQQQEPERFPKKEDITISREQADFLMQTGYKFGHTKEDILSTIYNLTKKIRLGELNNKEFDLILQFLADHRKENK